MMIEISITQATFQPISRKEQIDIHTLHVNYMEMIIYHGANDIVEAIYQSYNTSGILTAEMINYLRVRFYLPNYILCKNYLNVGNNMLLFDLGYRVVL